MNEQISLVEAEALLKQAGIPVIGSDVNYWFVRTSGGANFENFYFGNYIAIGWDEINDIKTLKTEKHEDIKKRVEAFYPEDTKSGSTASQIMRFVSEMKCGDYVLIPGSNCDRIAFGVITSDAYLYEPTDQDRMDMIFDGYEMDFLKRRNVEWITDVPFERSELDPMLIPIIYSYGTIVNANPYALFINRTLYDLYYQNGELHSIFNITKKENIPVYEFYEFINNVFDAMDIYSEISGFEVDKKELSIKASINSPGPVEIITAATSVFIFLAGLSLFLNGAKVKFSFNIFNIASGDININSPGLIERIQKLNHSSTEDEIKLSESQAKIEMSKANLEIKKKGKKK